MGKEFSRPYLEKTDHKKRLVEWFKHKALSSSPSTAKKKGKRNQIDNLYFLKI
jgi:hypothetical protein